MIIIFDLDHTLLNTNKLKKDIAGILNINIRRYNNDCQKYFADKNFVYSPYELLRILKKEKRVTSTKRYKERIENLLKRADKYLHVGALEVVKKFKAKGDKLMLLSVGDRKWQNKKINNLKIRHYFDLVIIIDGEKHKNLDFLKNSKEKILIINDNAGETVDMKKVIGKCEICLIHGPYSKNVKHNFKVYHRLSGIPHQQKEYRGGTT